IQSCETLRDSLPYIACSASSCSKTVCPNRRVKDGASISHACIPMSTGSELHGVLSIAFMPEKILSKKKLNVLLSIANQLSMAIQRYKLFERLQGEKLQIQRAYDEIASLNKMMEANLMELQETQQRLIQSEKLAATGRLAAGLCHEINNPMSIILSRIECINMEAGELRLPDVVINDLSDIYSYAAKVSSLVQDLLIFSRHHSAEFVQMDLNAMINNVLVMLNNEIEISACSIHKNIPLSLPKVKGDHDRLEQVFRNLLSNAIDAMPNGGNIYINACRAKKKDGFIEISVRDEGTGIDEENIHKVFDPFFTTKKLGKGTGLGLSICYGIIKSHGGDISVESVMGKGSVFSILLPIGDRLSVNG
ncbi:MAG: ATP-binding protein, partial [Nitrospirae bacterium]|nr:ATP-binding protein [Nitrospirota bacterium]